MIKVNLLDSVTDRSQGSVAVIETKVTDPRLQSALLALVVGALLVLGVVFDYWSASSSHQAMEEELGRQQQIAAQMAAVNREQTELEQKINAIQTRINAIRALRASQQGPVAVLSAVNERLPALNNFRLASIEQKSGELIISGDSPNEAAVTQFGRSLEFSAGLFSNVSIEIKREELPVASGEGAEQGPPPETVSFTIRCRYSPPGAPAAAPAAASAPAGQQVAQR